MYELVAAVSTGSPVVASSVPVMWTNLAVAFTAPATGVVKILYTASTTIQTMPDGVGGVIDIWETRGTGVLNVTRFQTNVYTASFFGDDNLGLSGIAGDQTVTIHLVRTNLTLNTRYQYDMEITRISGSGSVNGYDGNATAQVYFK
jgi:hypothetical protein